MWSSSMSLRTVKAPWALFLLAVAVGCSGDSLTAPPTKGILQISTTTTGAEPDLDGYTIQVDGGAAQAISVAGTWQSGEMDPGSYRVQLAGMAQNCTVAENPRTVSVTAGQTVAVAFNVTCGATTGSLEVTSVTSGPSPDPDGYTLTVDGTDRGPLGSSGALAVAGLTPGDHMVGLSGVAGNCQVQGDNPRAVTMTAGASASAAFTVVCAAPPPNAGSLHITTTTTGADQDADGYTLALEGGTSQPIGTSAQTTLTNLAAGPHSIQLSGVAANCSVAGANPRPVTVEAGATAEVIFAISCGTTSGSIKVSVTTSGAPTDPNGYKAKVDDKEPGLAVPTTGNVTFTGVAAGSHKVALTDVAPNCSAAGGASRDVTVAAGGNVDVSFVVTCAATNTQLTWRAMESGTNASMTDVWGSSATDVSAAAGSAVLHYNGQTWSERSQQGVVIGTLWGSAPDKFFGTGTLNDTPGLFRYDGQAWSASTFPEYERLYFWGVWGTSPTDVFAVGSTEAPDIARVFHFDGASWSPMTLPGDGDSRSLSSIGGSSPRDVYATGTSLPGQAANGFVFHYDGLQWRDIGFPTGPVPGEGEEEHFIIAGRVWAAPNHAFVVGYQDDRSMIFHYDGVRWTEMSTPAVALADVWGTSASNVYAVGANAILHYDGTSWTKVHDQGGNAVWGSSADDVFVVGSNGRILHGTR
jgi:hypothetical protein